MANEQHAPARFGPPAAGLDPSRGVALYAQLAGLFRYNVLSGLWATGHRLESFDALAAHYGVARITVRQAVATLVAEGLLTSQRGRGTFVRADELGAAPAITRVGAATSWPENLKIRIVYNEKALELPPEFLGDYAAFDSYVEISKIHIVGGTPFGMVRVYVAEDVYKRFPRRAIEKSKVLRLVFAHAGESALYMRQRMTVEPSDTVLSTHLQYPVGFPVAKILRQIYGDDRRLSYAGVSWYRGDSFDMDITLPRALVEESSPALIAPGVRDSQVPPKKS